MNGSILVEGNHGTKEGCLFAPSFFRSGFCAAFVCAKMARLEIRGNSEQLDRLGLINSSIGGCYLLSDKVVKKGQ
jgi:hypothetical protein